MKLSDLNPNDIQSIAPPPSNKKGGMRLSDLDPSEIVDVAIPEEKGFLGKAFETVDRYGSAPMRAAYGKFQDSLLHKGNPMDVLGAAKAAYDQFGEDPEKAPTAAQIVDKNPIGHLLNNKDVKESFAKHPMALGVRGLMAPVTGWDKSGEIVGEVPRTAAEFIVGGETDPLSYVPGAVIEKPLMSAGKQIAKVAPGLVNRSAGAAEFFTGVPKESWKNYITRNKQVKDLEKTFGPQVQDAADSMREGWNRAIQDKKSQLGLEIEQAVMNAPRKPNIPAEPILLELNNAKMGLNPNIPEHLSAIKEIDNHMNVVKSLAPEGKLTARDAFDLQKTLQGRGRSAYSVNGAIFNPAPQSAKAARDAARVTRQFVNRAMPGVAKANEAFTALHDIDDLLRTSLITPGKSNAGLMGAVGKTQNQDTVALRELGDWLDKDLLTETRDFATYKHMQGLGADASDKTGKAVYRAMMGGLVGAGGGYASSDDAKIGLIAGGLAGSLGTNPKLWRAALDAGIGTKAAISSLAGKGGLLEKGAEKINPTMRALEKRLEGAGGKAKEFIKDEEGAFSPDDLFKILKPGEENVFDLKKARGMAGEPKRGLLEPKDNPVANIDDAKRYGWKGWKKGDEVFSPTGRSFKVLDSDGGHLKVEFIDPDTGKRDTTWLTPKEQHNLSNEHPLHGQGFTQAEVVEQVDRNKPIGSNPLNKENGATVYRKSNPDGGDMFVTGYDEVTDNYRVWDGVSERWVKSDDLVGEKPPGLLTSLDVERGPVKELPEAGKVKPLLINDRPPELKPGTVVDLPNGKQVVTVGEYSHFEPGKGRVYWVEPSANAGFEPGTSGKEYQISEKEMLGEKYADYFSGKNAELEEGRRESNEFLRRFNTEKAAEAERLQKGLIGVDFGGRGGKVPKEKAPSFPKDSKFQKNQEVTYGGRPAKVVQYDGNGVYTVKVGNSHQQVHMSELKSGKGKPKKKK